MLNDGLGSVRSVYNDSLSETYSEEYAPYGDIWNSSGANPTPFQFTGQEMDSSGVQYHRARYYDPRIGAWLSLDPLETANRYGYVMGAPVNMVDPSGLQSEYDSCMERCSHTNYTSYECEVTCDATRTYDDLTKGLDYSSNPQVSLSLDGTGYIEGISLTETTVFTTDSDPNLSLDWLMSNVLSNISGQEIVYNFATFQRIEYTYTGSAAPNAIMAMSGGVYVGFINGFKRSNAFEQSICSSTARFTEFQNQYDGDFVFLSAGISAGIGIEPLISFSSSIGLLTFSSPTIQEPVWGASVYLNVGASFMGLPSGDLDSTLPFPVAPEITGGSAFYTPTDNRKSYIDPNTGEVKISELTRDILVGDGSTLGRSGSHIALANPASGALLASRIAMAANAALKANSYNNSRIFICCN